MSQSKQTAKDLFWEIFRFLLAGGLVTVTDYSVYYLFRQWILPPSLMGNVSAWDSISLVIATAFGFCVGLVLSWTLSVKFIYRDVKNKEEASSKKSFAVFAAIGLCGLLLTELGMHLLVGALPELILFQTSAFLGLPWKEWLAKVIMTCIVLVWNYAGRKIFIFKS